MKCYVFLVVCLAVVNGVFGECPPIDCVWGEWSAWTECSEPCGTDGQKTRQRSMTTEASCGGAECSGSSSETSGCNNVCTDEQNTLLRDKRAAGEMPDTTAPKVENVGLSRNGYKMLTVHHSRDLEDLLLEFEAYDYESGIDKLEWSLYDKEDSTKLHGSGAVPVDRLEASNCEPDTCYCIEATSDCFIRHFAIVPSNGQMEIAEGEHEYDYYFNITVTNTAQLETVYTFQITIDVSPPAAGVVKDSSPGVPDIDFQSSSLIHASWQNFFDRESGILLYKYGFSSNCLSSSDFSTPSEIIQSSTNAYASYTTPIPGTYHVTIVAYNSAMEPSSPVCSDGITVDDSTPEISQIAIGNLHARNGLALDETGEVWYISEDTSRALVANASDTCIHKAHAVENIKLYPITKTSIKTFASCSQQFGFENRFFLSGEQKLELSWRGEDSDSGIWDYAVGLSSNGIVADLQTFVTTAGHTHFLTYHAHLTDRTAFYVLLKATNRAGLDTMQSFGPITVVASPPIFNGNAVASYAEAAGSSYLVAKWLPSSYSPIELENGLISRHLYAIGELRFGEDIQHFTPISPDMAVPDLCNWTDPPLCVAIPVDHLKWGLHGEHHYYISVKVESITSLSRTITSDLYVHHSGPPRPGLVMELPLGSTDTEARYDIDQQTSKISVKIHWDGFNHPQNDIKYAVALGTVPGESDVKSFTDVTDANDYYLMNELDLQYFTTYYSSVKASSSDGSVVVSSDGITILPENVPLAGVNILDGPPCLTSGLSTGCGEDRQVQVSKTAIYAHWDIPGNMKTFITHMYWRVEEKIDIDNWQTVRAKQQESPVTDVNDVNLNLTPGKTYRTVIEFCHDDGCFQESKSDGVQILSDPPLSTQITDISATDYESTTKLTFKWLPFPNAYTGEYDTDHYEWTLATDFDGNTDDSQLLYPWELMLDSDIIKEANMLEYQKILPLKLELSACLVVVIRGYRQAGLHATSYKKFDTCSALPEQNLRVFDAVGEWNGENVKDISLTENANWQKNDAEFTPSSTTLSAVWPHWRHGRYDWKVISNSTIERKVYYTPQKELQYSDYACSSSGVLACGSTTTNFVNVNDLTLEDGHRYYICIHAEETTVQHETFNEHLPEASDCTNGIVAVLNAPKPGHVWVGKNGHLDYQADPTSLEIHWDSFRSAEELGHSSHHTAIRDYTVRIGLSSDPGTVYATYRGMSITNMAVTNQLSLLQGYSYKVKVTASDMFGRTTEADSPTFIIDASPPEIRDKTIHVVGTFNTPSINISSSWVAVFEDGESGIASYSWCIGSVPNICDVMESKQSSAEIAFLDGSENLSLEDGHQYYITVQAVNKVGLSAFETSPAFIVDTTPPGVGTVYETDGSTDGKDINFQKSTNILHLRWRGFHDPHSPIVKYEVSVENCPGCSNILYKSNVGLLTDLTLDHLKLAEGVTYYAKVQACNALGLCASAISDGVVPDNTAPSLGVVLDGMSGEDLEYQTSSNVVSAHWYNFVEPHSSLSHFEWRIQKYQGDDEVMSFTRLDVTSRATANLSSPLTIGVKYYVTVRAYNYAGLWSEASSNGFIVDATPPVVKEDIQIDTTYGSLKPNTQIWKSSLSVVWEVEDSGSYIKDQYLSLNTRSLTHHDTPTIKVHGNAKTYTFTNLFLQDGESYKAQVTACNAAGLCTHSISDSVLVDNSPPVPGAFYIRTEHAAELDRHRNGIITYTNNAESGDVTLLWLGLDDPHSSINDYYITIGTTYRGSQLLDTDFVKVTHSSEDPIEGEGFIQTAVISTNRPLDPSDSILISIWAENKVGLTSIKLHGTFSVSVESSSGGQLKLVRRCDTISCEGHCTCPDQTGCHTTGVGSCTVIRDNDKNYAKVDVYSQLNYKDFEATTDTVYTRSKSTIGAWWSVETGPANSPVWYEWSVGIKGQDPGSGLLDISHDPVWRDSGYQTHAIFTTSISSLADAQLLPNTEYEFHVKAWYDSTSYNIFHSSGIQTGNMKPEVSSSRKVKKVKNKESNKDVDFVTSSDVTVMWDDVFQDNQGGFREFEVAIKAHKGSEDIAVEVVSDGATSATFTDLKLEESRRYITKVTAKNQAGLQSSAYSGGFVFDSTPPVPGTVCDGHGIHDEEYTSDNTHVSAFWYGFSDNASFIDHYIWCVGSTPGEENILECQDVGLILKAKATVPPIESGTVFSTVYGVNGAGLRSAAATSKGVTIDVTPPIVSPGYTLGDNQLKNPSFEDATDESWEIDGTVSIISGGEVTAQNGDAVAHVIRGSISQSIPTISTKKYMLTFYVRSHSSGNAYGRILGFVSLPGVYEAFMPKSKSPSKSKPDDRNQWQKQTFFFTATSDSSKVQFFPSSTGKGFYLDNAILQNLVFDGEEPASGLQVHIHTNDEFSSLSASCDMTDDTSPIVKYLWAVGTVKGGTQILNFFSTGPSSQMRQDHLLLPHGNTIHVTAVIQNAAGLSTIVYSESLLMDLTRPEICCVAAVEAGRETRFITSKTLTAKWEASDPESGILGCEWAIGQARGSGGIFGFVETTSTLESSFDLAEKGIDGGVYYITIRCTNHAGLYDIAFSDGISLVLSAPDVSGAKINIVTISPSIFPTRDAHQADVHSVSFTWDGFVDQAGIKHCEVQVEKGGLPVVSWKKVAQMEETFVTMTGLNLNSYATYDLRLRAVSNINKTSSEVSSSFVVENNSPIASGLPCLYNWSLNAALDVNWTGIFSSNSSLTYVLIARAGDSQQVTRQETDETSIRINGFERTNNLYVEITAVNMAGLYTSLACNEQ